MKFIIDDKIPYCKGVLEPFGEVLYLAGKDTTPEIVKSANALITRTRTICNKELLENSSVSLVASATIGFDHIDTKYCESNNIEWTNAPGCNSGSVEQYVATALSWFSIQKRVKLKGKTIGIVGVGNVGKKIKKIAEFFEMNVLLNDPPRERDAEDQEDFVSLSTIQAEADVITFHTPLNREGNDSTFHLANSEFFEELKRCPLILNSSRGEVIDTTALKNAVKAGTINGAIIDCWENEPTIDSELVELTDLATPHIAGYSRDGKANGTSMSIRALSKKFLLGIDDWSPQQIETPKQNILNLDSFSGSEEDILKSVILHTYNITGDDAKLRNDLSTFEKQRGEYPVRREFLAYTVQATSLSDSLISKLTHLGFRVVTK